MQRLYSNESRIVTDWLGVNVNFNKKLLDEIKQEQALRPESAARVFVGVRGCVVTAPLNKPNNTKRFQIELQAKRFLILHWRQGARSLGASDPYSDDPPADTSVIFCVDIMLTYKREPTLDPNSLFTAGQKLMEQVYDYAFKEAFPDRRVITDYAELDKPTNPVMECTWSTEIEPPPIEED